MRQKQRLLRDVIKRVIVDAEGNILKFDLLPPFAYLSRLKDVVVTAAGSGDPGEKCKTPGFVTERCCVPEGIRTPDLWFRRPSL